MSELAKALAKAQDEFPPIERSKIVTVTTKIGGKYSFSYAPLDAILHLVRPVLTKNGLAFSQLLSQTADGKPALRTSLLHADGETLEDTCPLPTNGEAMSPQEFGSLVTYMRRYAAVSILGLASEEDDDGNAAQGTSVQRTAGDPDEEAKEAAFLKAVETAQVPSEMPCHFGKNRGVLLGELTPAQLRWYADKWMLQDEPTEYDHRLKAAAVALALGDNSPIESDPYPDVPFA